jgi:integrase
MTKALTAKRIETVQATSSRQEIPDGLLVGLYLVVQPSGAKSFAVRYRYAGQPRKLTLGAFPAVSLEVARAIGAKALRAAAEGRDPAKEKQAAKGDAKRQAAEEIRGKRDLFENVAREFIERHAMKQNRETTWRETARILGFKPDPDNAGKLLVVEPQKGKPPTVLQLWNGRKVQDITKRDVITLLDTVRDRAPVMANRNLAAVRKLFNWCLARDIIQVSPCTLIDPPALESSRDRILSDDELRLVWNAAGSDGRPFEPLVKLLVLTGQRLGEVAGMRWSEIDFKDRLWIIPAERVKNGERHEVPLSDAAIAIISALPRIKTAEGAVFTTRSFSRAKTRLDGAILAAMPKGAKAPEPWVFHDLRRTLASGMARLGIQLPVIEKVMNHTSGSFRGIVGVYQRHSFAEEKRAALAAWASHVESVVSGRQRANVVALRAAP